jgi:hypothetical protein
MELQHQFQLLFPDHLVSRILFILKFSTFCLQEFFVFFQKMW